MSDPALPDAALPAVHTPARRKRPATLLLAGVLSIGLVLVSDRGLRSRQNLIAGIANKNLPSIFVPLSDLLSTKVEKKITYLQLRDKAAATRADTDHTKFVNTSYDLGAFISAEMGDQNPRRRDVLLDVVAVAGDAPISNKAYWALLDPAWTNKLRPQYPAYVDAITGFAEGDSKGLAATLVQLSQQLKAVNEPKLELATLQKLHAASPVTVVTVPAMQRLSTLLPPDDPEQQQLKADVEKFQSRREELAQSMKWHTTFVSKLSPGRLADLEAARKTAPTGETNAFIAAADAALATAYAKLGRSDEANKLSVALTKYDMADAEDSIMLATQASSEPAVVPGKNAPPAIPPPDLLNLQLQRWRGFLLTGEIDKADQIAEELFAADLKSLYKSADEEKLVATGALDKLSPSMAMKKRTDNLPPELTGQTEALYAQFTLKPTFKTTPADIHTTADVWVAGGKCVIVVSADEPRGKLPAPTATARDKAVWSDESIELFFDPDHWYDMYYQIDANSAGTIFDARVPNTGTMTRRVYTRSDPSLNLPMTVTPSKTPTGWQLRFVLPRTPLLPATDGVIKFNVRRFRRVTENNAIVLHQYSWTGVPGTDHRPEQFGWLILPK